MDVEVIAPRDGAKGYVVRTADGVTGVLVDGIPEGTTLSPGQFVKVVVKAADVKTNIQFKWPRSK